MSKSPLKGSAISVLCQCPDCYLNPSPHPSTGLPSTGPAQGRWVTKKERAEHTKKQRQYLVANLLLPSSDNDQSGTAFPSSIEPHISDHPDFDYEASPTPFSFISPPDELFQNHNHSHVLSENDKTILRDLAMLCNQIRDANSVVSNDGIYFIHAPTQQDVAINILQLDDVSCNKLCELDSRIPSNSGIIGYQTTLAKIAAHAQAYSHHDCVEVRLKAEFTLRVVKEQQGIFRTLLVAEWQRQQRLLRNKGFFQTDRFLNNPAHTLPITVLAVYLLFGTLHLLSHLSLDDSNFGLKCIRTVFAILLSTSGSIHAPSVSKFMHGDIRSVMNIFEIYPRSEPYIVCPDCSKLHSVDPSNPGASPTHCEGQEFGEQCGKPLQKERRHRTGSTSSTPKRPYQHQPLKDYIARLYSRPELRKYLDRNLNDMQTGGGAMWDVWDAPCLSEFKGVDGNVFVNSKSEGRLIFSLNMDGFNPYGNREAGKTVSVGGIYMICLNLPPSLRYKMEYVYLAGIIPGPHSPSAHEINYFLAPLVDDLLEVWNTGVFLSRTINHPLGWRVRCALGPLVCDLPACRQMSGFAHYRSKHFCSECDRTIDQINDISPTWSPRSWSHILSAARLWRAATSKEAREAVVNSTGVRWSELYRLPYWDPTRFTLIDSMHAFYLRMFQHHCRSVWGMDVRFDDGDGVTYDRGASQPLEEEMRVANNILRHGTEAMLKQLSRPILQELCRETTTIPFRRNKAQLLEDLVEYRIRQGWFTGDGIHLGNPEQQKELTTVTTPSTTELESSLFPTVVSLESFYLSASKTKVGALNKPELILIFRRKVLPFISMTEDEVPSLQVLDLKRYIHQQRHADGITNESGKVVAASPAKKTRVLGRETLAEVRRDIANLKQPTWVARPPSNPGEKRYGKFTADQWRTFCMHNLPVTLTRLWGAKPEGSVERRRLDNFMHLVSAVKLATMHTVTEERIVKYEYHAREYLRTLLELFPGTSITPYQHLSLHFGRQLRLFGPVHAWRCFPFERFNYLLQKMPTNERFGEFEKTMFTKFCCAQNLKALYNPSQLPEKLHDMIGHFEENFASDLRGTRLSDVFADDDKFGVLEETNVWKASDFSELVDDDFDLLKQWMSRHRPGNTKYSRRVVLRKSLHRFGQRFTSRHTSLEDSQVIFMNGGRPRAGSISGIFSHATVNDKTTSGTWAIIQLYEDISDEDTLKDPYLNYPVIGGALFKMSWEPRAVLVDMSQIRCHFAACPIHIDGLDGDYQVVLPLNKV